MPAADATAVTAGVKVAIAPAEAAVVRVAIVPAAVVKARPGDRQAVAVPVIGDGVARAAVVLLRTGEARRVEAASSRAAGPPGNDPARIVINRAVINGGAVIVINRAVGVTVINSAEIRGAAETVISRVAIRGVVAVMTNVGGISGAVIVIKGVVIKVGAAIAMIDGTGATGVTGIGIGTTVAGVIKAGGVGMIRSGENADSVTINRHGVRAATAAIVIKDEVIAVAMIKDSEAAVHAVPIRGVVRGASIRAAVRVTPIEVAVGVARSRATDAVKITAVGSPTAGPRRGVIRSAGSRRAWKPSPESRAFRKAPTSVGWIAAYGPNCAAFPRIWRRSSPRTCCWPAS